MNNLHISLTEFRNESRVLKETKSILSHGIANKVYIAALYSDGLLENEIYESDIEIKRFNLSSRKLSRRLSVQLIKYLEFILRIIFFYRDKNIKIINIHSIALLPVGVLLKYLYGAKLVYDTHELETETNGLRGLRKKLSKILEKVLIKKVDKVFVVSENIADWYRSTYNIERPTVIMNTPKWFHQKKTNHFRTILGIKEYSRIVLYQGGLMKGRGIDLLLRTFQKREKDDVVIVFMGYGELEEKIKQSSIEYDTIFFHPAVSPDIVLEYTSAADIGISFIENTCLSYYYCLPNKLFEYTMVGLPVIVSDMKEMREMVEKYKIGMVVKEANDRALSIAIDKIVDLDIKQLKINVEKFAKENTWEKQEKKMIDIYKGLVNYEK